MEMAHDQRSPQLRAPPAGECSRGRSMQGWERQIHAFASLFPGLPESRAGKPRQSAAPRSEPPLTSLPRGQARCRQPTLTERQLVSSRGPGAMDVSTAMPHSGDRARARYAPSRQTKGDRLISWGQNGANGSDQVLRVVQSGAPSPMGQARMGLWRNYIHFTP